MQTRFFAPVTLTLTRCVTLIYESDLNILKMYSQTKHKLFRSRLSTVRTSQTDTDVTMPHSQVKL